jgi:glycosyltransferase involved in cell wall biosynthesis
VLILVKGGVRRNAHVRKSALSLHEAGFEVLVLGAVRRDGPETPGWEHEEGFELKVVPVPNASVPRRQRRASERVRRLEARRGRIERRLRELGGQAGSEQRSPLRDRLAFRALSRRNERTRDRAKRARERAKQLKASLKTSSELDDPLELARYEAAWWPLVRKLRPDVVHVSDVSALSTARRAGRLGARWIYEAREPKRHRGEQGLDLARRRQAAEYAVHADAVIATSAPLGELLVTELDLPRVPALVHNTPSLRAGAAPKPGLRETVGVAADAPLLVYGGVLTRHRRLEVVLEAMTMLPEVRFALLVSLEDPLMRELLARAEGLDVSDRVHVVPKVPPESVVPFSAEADVGVIPFSRTPGQDMALPNKLFEYLHAGLPIVISDATAMADFVRRHGLGEVAPLHDARAWAQAIERALQPPYYRERASQWEALKEEWCWERQAERLVGVYSEVLGSPLRR